MGNKNLRVSVASLLPILPTMTKKVVGWALLGLGLTGFGLLHILALQDDRPFITAFMDRASAVASSFTALAIGAVLLLRPHERRLAPLIILATLLLDAMPASLGQIFILCATPTQRRCSFRGFTPRSSAKLLDTPTWRSR